MPENDLAKEANNQTDYITPDADLQRAVLDGYYPPLETAELVIDKLLEPSQYRDGKDFFDTLRLLGSHRKSVKKLGLSAFRVMDTAVDSYLAIDPVHNGELKEHFDRYLDHLAAEQDYSTQGKWESQVVFILSDRTGRDRSELFARRLVEPEKLNLLANDPTTEFWLDIFQQFNTIQRSEQKQYRVREHLGMYLFRPGITEKDPELILKSLDYLHEHADEDSLAIKNTPAKAVSMAYSLVKIVLDEAAAIGWENAATLIGRLKELPQRDVPPHSLLISLANQLTLSLNKLDELQEQPLTKLKINRPEDAPEAVNRIMYATFELGKAPTPNIDTFSAGTAGIGTAEGRPSARNFLLTAAVASFIFEHAAHNIRGAGQPNHRKDQQFAQNSELHADMKDRSDKASFWQEWQEEYGLSFEQE